MKKEYRVKSEKDFRAIFEKGDNCANRRFVVYHLNQGHSHFRIGLSVGKKLGNAVTRNRIKRQLRHNLMALSDGLIAKDIVIIARKGVEQLDYNDIKKNLIHILKLANLYEEEA